MSLAEISRGVVFSLGVLILGTPFPVRADIDNWQTGEVIPGTEGIEPGPGVDLRGWNTPDHNLVFADFSGGLDLTGSLFGAQCCTDRGQISEIRELAQFCRFQWCKSHGRQLRFAPFVSGTSLET